MFSGCTPKGDGTQLQYTRNSVPAARGSRHGSHGPEDCTTISAPAKKEVLG
jgi:hypothetical protein